MVFFEVNHFGHWTDDDHACSVFAMKTLADRLTQRMSELGMTQEELAKKAGVSQTAIHKLCAGKAKQTRKLVQIADALRVRPQWLDLGTGSMEFQTVTGTTNTTYDINVEPAPNIFGTVPLISWVQAGEFCLAPDLFEPGDAEDWVPCVQKLGPHAYALRVRGDSMTASYGRSYPEGCLIFVDPDAPITNGCRVIARVPGTEEATFKVYVEDAGKRFLRPLNVQYPTIEMTPDMVLCGVVRGYYMPE